jgi:glycosyltransferase involved in cell wall biosynthesis
MFQELFSIQWISILIASYNTPAEYVKECLDSIYMQQGLGVSFKIELVWINDGSHTNFSQLLENILKDFKKQQKCKDNIKINYFRLETNQGLSYCLHYGVLLCTYDLIFRMDSDDIMHESRIQKQLEFMNHNPKCVLCGTNIICFSQQDSKNGKEEDMLEIERSHHPSLITWEQYKKTKKFWILNHPTLCFRKHAIIHVGNYDQYMRDPFEDLDLELRIMKQYGFVCNLPDYLLYYRLHENQITWSQREKSRENNQKKKALIEKIIQS